MSKVRSTSNDEIDLIEILETLWDGKWIICTFIVLAALISFVYLQVTHTKPQPKYNVSASFTFNMYSVFTQQICPKTNSVNAFVSCANKIQFKWLVPLLLGDWKKDKSGTRISLTTTTPLDVNEYQAQLVRVNQKLTKEYYAGAMAEIELIRTQLPNAMVGTEKVAGAMIDAIRIIDKIDSGQNVIRFGLVSITNAPPSLLPRRNVVTLSLVLGMVMGILFVLTRNAIRKRKEYLVNT
jgi:LPS O-antigen subunit length determinant protein (WzzB/FepE family)